VRPWLFCLQIEREYHERIDGNIMWNLDILYGKYDKKWVGFEG
jgi:hypothetical protein